MELSSNSQDCNITLYFVVPQNCKPEDCSKLLKYAYQACREHELGPIWLTSEECLGMIPSKQEVFVCDPFEGDAFEFLLSGTFKCVRVLGPRCLLMCLHSKKPVPELPCPLHNMAMHDIVVTSTGFEKEEKTHLQHLVEKMCGIYSNSFHEGITHLVAKVVGTKKYLVAVEKEIPTMTEEWVISVWKCASEEMDECVSATQERFSRYTCPVFRGLVICVSQLPRKEKDAIRDLIEKNGGTYAPNLEMSTTSILIAPAAEGEKYKHASQWRIPCITQDWIYHSVENGFALAWDSYKIQNKPKASTPTSDHSIKVVPPDASICSTIMNESTLNGTTHINETMESDCSLVRKHPDPRISAGVLALEDLDLQKSYKTGLFLDGCKIFAFGFNPAMNEKLRRILNAGGATRFNHLTDSVTHVIIGKHIDDHLNTISSWNVKPQVVTADWLVECVNHGRPVEEEKFSYLKGECVVRNISASPSSSYLLNKITPKSCSKQPRDDSDKTVVDEELMNQYLVNKEQKTTRKNMLRDKSFDCSALPDSQESTCGGGIFKGQVFVVSGYPEEVEEQLIDLICENGGEVVEAISSRFVDYSIVSVEGEGNFHPNARNYVTHIFVEDCLEQEILVPVEYFHMPFVWSSVSGTLNGCVLGTSIYKGKERPFIINLATTMGALYQDMFAKKDNPSRGVKASTHLLCPLPEGSKYVAAQKWGVPAITKDWLLKCAAKGYRASEEPFRVERSPSEQIDSKGVLLSLLRQAGKLPESRLDLSGFNDDDSLVSATPFNKKVKALKEQHCEVAQIHTPDAETIRKIYPTPGAPPANDSLDNMPTPETPYGTTWYRNPPARVRKGLKRALDSLPDDTGAKRPFQSSGTPDEVYFRKYSEKLKDIVANHPIPKPPFWGKESSTDPEEKDPDELPTELDRPADHSGPLSGVVVYTSKKLSTSQQALYRAVEALGGDYRWSYDRTVTHFVHQGRTNNTNREFRTARDEGKIIVAPDWVWMCRDEGKRVDEALFPHTLNPKMTLSIYSTKSTPMQRRSRKPKAPGKISQVSAGEDTGEEEQEVEGCKKGGKEAKLEEEKPTTIVDPSKEKLAKQLEELGTLTSVTGGALRRTPNAGSRNRNVPEVRRTSAGTPSTERATANTESESQGTAITWDDPQEREARARLDVALVGDTQDILAQKHEKPAPKVDEVNFLPETGQFTSTSENRPSASYLFAFSGMSEEEKNRFSSVVLSLGGSVVNETKTLDLAVTHVVTIKPTRSEKHLVTIACGKWLVYKSFLESSEEAGHFVDEEEHEWGNDKAVNLPTFREGSTEEKLAAAAHRWRLQLTETGEGVFHGMTAIFYANNEKVPAYTRLVEAGGGQVVRNLEAMDEVTHCFVEGNVSKVDLALFAAKHVPCIAPLYLNELLITYPPPDELESCLAEYKTIIANMTSREPSLGRKTS